MPEIHETCVIAADPEMTFQFFLRPQLVIDASDPDLGATIVDSPEVLSDDDCLTIKIVAFNIVRNITYHARVNGERRSLIETMTDGDLKQWIHETRIEPHENGALVIDHVDFEPPGGVKGFFMTADRVLEQGSDSIVYRNERLEAAVLEFSKTLSVN